MTYILLFNLSLPFSIFATLRIVFYCKVTFLPVVLQNNQKSNTKKLCPGVVPQLKSELLNSYKESEKHYYWKKM